MMRIAVVAVGDELLLGDGVNSNLTWLARELAQAGMQTVRGIEVGDNLAELVPALRGALEVADAVVVTGGLGPTSDDRTREALATLGGVELRRDPELASTIGAWFAERGRPAPQSVFGQADVPEGARPLGNGLGTAPGIHIEIAGRPVYAVPGVPTEMRLMFGATVLPDLRSRAGSPRPLLTRQARVSGVGESAVADRLAEVEADLPAQIALAYLASPGEVRVRLTGIDPQQLDAWLDRVASVLGEDVSGFGDETLPATVLWLLVARSETVATAESLTGGAVASALVDIPGASAAFVGGVVAYATALKVQLLGVDAGLLETNGTVDPQVALEMARGVRSRLGADWGISTTGVAGPLPEAAVEPGTAFIAVVGPSVERVVQVKQMGGRDLVRQVVRVRVLDLLRRSLLAAGSGRPDPEHTP